MLELIFAYGAGLLTLINPCVLPVLPIVLVSALNADRRGPIALAAGMSLSFVVFGMLVASVGHAIGLNEKLLAQIGAAMMIAFGLILIIPAFAAKFETVAAGLSTKADSQMTASDDGGLKGQFVGGVLLGAVWSPCIGPTLGGAIALASQGESMGKALAIMIFFALGVSILILVIGLSAREAIRKRANSLRAIAERSKPIMGGVFIAVGVMIMLGVHHMIEAWAVRNLPYWLQDLSVSL